MRWHALLLSVMIVACGGKPSVPDEPQDDGPPASFFEPTWPTSASPHPAANALGELADPGGSASVAPTGDSASADNTGAVDEGTGAVDEGTGAGARGTTQTAVEVLCGQGASVTVGDGRLKVTFDADVMFAFDEYALAPEAIDALTNARTTLIDPRPNAQIVVEGHTDDIGKNKYNQWLSTRRATAVAAWLTDSGIDSERVKARGYGEDYPRDTNATDEGRARNRRVELVIIDSSLAAAPTSEAAERCDSNRACCELAKNDSRACIEVQASWPSDLVERDLVRSNDTLRLDSCTKTRGAAVWITSTDERKVAKLDDRTGEQLFRVPTYGKTPQRTAIARDGSVWITNRDSGSYVHIASTGELLCSSELDTCYTRAAAVDSDGNPWIGCYNEQQLIKVDPNATDGTTVVHDYATRKDVTVPRCVETSRVDVPGVRPYGLVADRDGGLWVGVNGGPIAKVNARTGDLIGTWDVRKDDETLAEYGGCWIPYGITIDRDGNPWFTNRGCGNVVKVDGATGAVIGAFSGPEGMKTPRAAGVDRRGHIWVSENGNSFVNEFEPDGTWVKRVDVTECGGAKPGTLGVGSDSDGHIWVVLQRVGKVVELTTDGDVLGCYPEAPTEDFRSPYTYSDLTGSSLDLGASDTGRVRVRFEHDAPVAWRLLAMEAVVPSGTSLCVRTRTITGGDGDAWSAAACPAPVDRTTVSIELDGRESRALEVEVELSASVTGRTPMVSGLSVAAQ